MQQPPDETAGGRDVVVFFVRRATQCATCARELERGSLLRVEDEQALCLACRRPGLSRVPAARGPHRHATCQEVLGAERPRARVVADPQALRAAGPARRAGGHSARQQESLAEPAAIRRAEQESLADAEWRARQRARAAARRTAEDHAFLASFAEAIRAQFPSCPADEAASIATHACQKSSGRVGRSAAAKAFDPEVVRLAVLAHIRHAHTPYDRLLGQLGNRGRARARVQEQVEAMLRNWEEPSEQ